MSDERPVDPDEYRERLQLREVERHVDDPSPEVRNWARRRLKEIRQRQTDAEAVKNAELAAWLANQIRPNR